MTDTAGALAGLSIAITRPAPQGEALAERLRNCAAAATTIPLLAIAPLDSPAQRESVKTQLQNLGAIDIAILSVAMLSSNYYRRWQIITCVGRAISPRLLWVAPRRNC